MRIVRLQAENFKRIEVIDITPTGDVVQITGPNGSGKSSVLDSIFALVGGKTACPVEPVRAGEKKATIQADLGQYVVKRTFGSDGKTTLTVESSDGAKYSSAQKLLDSFLGSLSFDPLEFARMKPREQYETIRQVAGIGREIDEIDAKIKEEYEERTSWNRQAKEAAAAAAGVIVPDDLPDEPLNVAQLAEQMEQAVAHNNRLSQLLAERDKRAGRIKHLREQPVIDVLPEIEQAKNRSEKRVKELEGQIDALRLMIQNVVQEYDRECQTINARAELARRAINKELTELQAVVEEPVPELVDVLAIKEQMANAQHFNGGIMQREKRQELETKAENARTMAQTLTASMESRAAEKQRIIQGSKLPISDIDLVEGEVRYRGVPFAQASDAERLRVSAALAIAMNPRLRILRVKDGGLLDSTSLGILREMCAENNFQVWIEQVDETGKVGVVMSEGRVVADNQKKEKHEDEEE